MVLAQFLRESLTNWTAETSLGWLYLYKVSVVVCRSNFIQIYLFIILIDWNWNCLGDNFSLVDIRVKMKNLAPHVKSLWMQCCFSENRLKYFARANRYIRMKRLVDVTHDRMSSIKTDTIFRTCEIVENKLIWMISVCAGVATGNLDI